MGVGKREKQGGEKKKGGGGLVVSSIKTFLCLKLKEKPDKKNKNNQLSTTIAVIKETIFK